MEAIGSNEIPTLRFLHAPVAGERPTSPSGEKTRFKAVSVAGRASLDRSVVRLGPHPLLHLWTMII